MNLEERVAKIEARNKRVERDKDWEVSWTRRVILMISTYLTIALYMKFVVRINPWINAIIPTAGFFISTLTLPWVRKFWTKYFYKKQ